LKTVLDPQKLAARRADDVRQALAQAPANVRQLGATAPVLVPEIRLVELPANADVQKEKAWLNASQDENTKHLALVVIHPDAVKSAPGQSADAIYDLYVPASLDDRADTEIQQSLRDAIVNARIHEQSLDRNTMEAILRVPRVRSVTITKGQEQQTVGGFN